MSKNLSEETLALGTFLTNFLNCKLRPDNMSALVNECLIIMKRYLGYNNPKWNEVQITSEITYYELVSRTEQGYFKSLIAPLFRTHTLGGFHPKKDFIFNEYRKLAIRRAFRKFAEYQKYNWDEFTKLNSKHFIFFIEFALHRKNFRRIINRMINKGETLEQISNDKYLGDFILRLGSEYNELTQQLIVSKNKAKIGSQMTDLPEMTYSPKSFLDAFLLPCLSYCFFKGSEHGVFFKRLKKCPFCRKFFIAKDIKRVTRCYSNQCEKEYMRDKKRKQREAEPEIYRY